MNSPPGRRVEPRIPYKISQLINYYWYFPQDHSTSGYGNRPDPQPPDAGGRLGGKRHPSGR